MNYSKIMNRISAITELDELKEHIDTVISEIENGEYDQEGELSYQVSMAHLMDHLVRAWHFSKLTDEQIAVLNQEAFERITYSIPKLNADVRLVEPSDKIT